ncbi:MAG: hypothetical protein MZU97_21390 [Bacillus subtilis]|nr:hypothetical protein [Bacillus subtilis]
MIAFTRAVSESLGPEKRLHPLRTDLDRRRRHRLRRFVQTSERDHPSGFATGFWKS